MSKGLGSEIYSGAASFGKIRAIFGVIFGTIIGIGLIIGGFFAIAHKTKLTGTTTGTVVNDKDEEVPVNHCQPTVKNNETTYQCNFRLRYKVDNVSHHFVANIDSNTDYSNDTKIDVYYDPSNPNNASLTKDDYHTVGWILVGSGIFVLLLAWISLWIVLHYKFAAAASGAAGAIEMVKAI